MNCLVQQLLWHSVKPFLCCKEKKLNHLTEVTGGYSTRSITVIWGLWVRRGHVFFYGLSTARMNYFSGKWHLLGNSSEDALLSIFGGLGVH